MKPSLSRFRFSILLVVLTMALSAVGFTGAQDEQVLVIGHAESTDSLDPARGFTQTTGIVHKAIYETLVTFPNEDASEILPGLATEWTISDDGLVYTFTLKEGVLFSNGDPMTAEDVVFSFNRLKNIQGNPSFLAETIQSVEASDDQTVVLTLTQPDPAILAKIIFGGFGVVNAEQVRANGGTDAADAATTDTAEAWLNINSAGTGPYMLESWEPQVETVLVRNPNYAGEPPYFDRVIITNIAEAATQKTALEGGDVDIALDLTLDQVPSLEGNDSVSVFQATGPIVHFLLMNQDPGIGGPMSDPLVQLAVRLALDYEGYRALWGGETPASVIPVGFGGAYGSDRALTRDLERAGELLDEAGYPDPDGADGPEPRFEVTLDYPEFSFQGVNMGTNAEKIVADLAEVGIQVSLNPGEIQVALEGYRAGTEGFGYWFWGPDYIDPGDYLVFLPERLVGLRAQWTEDRGDETVLDIRDRGEVETDPDARTQIFAEMQDYLQENGPWAPFIQPGVQIAYRSDIEGVTYHIQWLIDVAILSRSM
jgi:peptide/nickel transport system substrate-binding protein